MLNPFFSIIIPAYNTVHYLPSCLNSLFEQSCGDFEIILVNDGSTDGTGLLADQMATKNAQMRVLHISHSGVSAARNAGLKEAVGEYVLFLDSDDRLTPNALECIQTKLQDKPDLLWFGFLYQMEDGSIHEGKKLQNTNYPSASEAAIDWIKKNMLPVSAANKVFRLSVIKKFRIMFREAYSFGEDRLFNLDYLKHCGQVTIIADNLYIYMVRDGSASHRFVPEILPLMLMLSEERLSALLPLCSGKLSEEEYQIFSQRDYVKSLRFAWTHLAKYYHTMTPEQRKQALHPYLDIRFPEKMERKALPWSVCLWFMGLKTAVSFNSLSILKLMMPITVWVKKLSK